MRYRKNRSPRSRPAAPGKLSALPRGIWALGFVSLFMDVSSELIHSLLPVFMAATLGASVALIGLIEGAAEAAAAITKVFSGTVSDYLRKRKPPAVLGYGLGAAAKPVFPLAGAIGWVFGARFIDRIGKGIRGAPRDALVAEIAPRPQRGAAYGLRQALDSVGAFLGPLLAVLFMFWLQNDIRKVMWAGTVPAFLAVGLLVFGVREPKKPQVESGTRRPFSLRGAGRLPPRYWFVVPVGAVFTLARFSEAFLVLRARSVGLSLGLVPAILIIMNVVYAATAYPCGAAADRMNPRSLLQAGLVVLAAADLILAAASSPPAVFAGAALWGLHMGLTQGLFNKLVADAAPAENRGAAFGVFNLAVGVALLAASALAGILWNAFGASTTFLAGAAFAALALIGLTLYQKILRPAGQ